VEDVEYEVQPRARTECNPALRSLTRTKVTFQLRNLHAIKHHYHAEHDTRNLQHNTGTAIYNTAVAVPYLERSSNHYRPSKRKKVVKNPTLTNQHSLKGCSHCFSLIFHHQRYAGSILRLHLSRDVRACRTLRPEPTTSPIPFPRRVAKDTKEQK
jgi:hypothetical protein